MHRIYFIQTRKKSKLSFNEGTISPFFINDIQNWMSSHTRKKRLSEFSSNDRKTKEEKNEWKRRQKDDNKINKKMNTQVFSSGIQILFKVSTLGLVNAN
ncbi:hypothetical protein MTR_5g013430 [Medicago truncatula]|uniref:Uncharacterized protein n=1 Tax=Medicago truncatula TaxID=3880 RepID=G7JYL1_MEDTR|nr:hypothetical protein MTR_5g013430 [Medicago truncatula]